MKAVLILFNAILEVVFFLLFPFIWFWLSSKHYLNAMFVKGKNSHKGILFHAASMGEVSAIEPLVNKLKKELPDKQICITTSTITGLNLAKRTLSETNSFLSALDIPHLRYKQLKLLNPGLICIVETEIWPNMLAWAVKNKIPVLFINARLSQRSLPGYLRLKPLLGSLDKTVAGIYAQSEADAERFKRVFNKPVQVCGNLKYSKQMKDYDYQELRENWGYKQDDFVICFGSSRPGEEALMLSLWERLSSQLIGLKLIIAIRHPNRMDELKNLFMEHKADIYSKQEHRKSDILIIDVLGVLDKAYALCDLAIVGGSFFDFGGHNPLEPAYYSKPIIMGKHHSSCKDSVAKLLQGEGIKITDPLHLADDITSLYNDQQLCKEMGERAKKVLTENSRSLDIHLKAIKDKIEGSE